MQQAVKLGVLVEINVWCFSLDRPLSLISGFNLNHYGPMDHAAMAELYVLLLMRRQRVPTQRNRFGLTARPRLWFNDCIAALPLVSYFNY